MTWNFFIWKSEHRIYNQWTRMPEYNVYYFSPLLNCTEFAWFISSYWVSVSFGAGFSLFISSWWDSASFVTTVSLLEQSWTLSATVRTQFLFCIRLDIMSASKERWYVIQVTWNPACRKLWFISIGQGEVPETSELRCTTNMKCPNKWFLKFQNHIFD